MDCGGVVRGKTRALVKMGFNFVEAYGFQAAFGGTMGLAMKMPVDFFRQRAADAIGLR